MLLQLVLGFAAARCLRARTEPAKVQADLIPGDRPKPPPKTRIRSIMVKAVDLGRDSSKYLLNDIRRIAGLQSRLASPGVHQRYVQLAQGLPGFRFMCLCTFEQAQRG